MDIEIPKFPPMNISFNQGSTEVIRIEKGKFFYMREEVEDIHNIYERFNDWLTSVEKK